MILRPSTPEEIQEIVRTHDKLLPRGGNTKTALSTPRADQTVLELSGLSGVKEYDPGEYVFLAQAGTRLAEVREMLEQNGQYLPFDPPLVKAGATLGGTVAAGLSGSMRWRYGGVRDFILGVKFVDGAGNLIQGGGKVVKNAAGFDLPKLMVGSLGRLGVMVELAFKVFPAPRAWATLKLTFGGLEAALEALYKLAGSNKEVYALDLEPPATLWLRLGGLGEGLGGRLERLHQFLGGSAEVLGDDTEYWSGVREFEWAGGKPVVKVALTAKRVPALESVLPNVPRRYLAGANLLYLAWDDELSALDTLLKNQRLSGLVLTGSTSSPLIGLDLQQAFSARVTPALDPRQVFAPPPKP